jgi:nicotinamide-nucleotide adenylyltransferase
MTTALFVGRFQPFHTGHLDAVKQILESCNNITIVIGSAQYSNTNENPFTAEERKRIIEAVLSAENITNYKIIPLEDINDDERWVEYVKEHVHSFDSVYTGNEYVTELFTKAGYEVKHQSFNINISGIRERQYIKDDDPAWREFLHPAAIKILKEIDGFERIKMKIEDLQLMLEQANQPDMFPLTELPFWTNIPKDKFNKFLLESRVIAFFKLILLHELANDTDTFVVGRTHATFREYEECCSEEDVPNVIQTIILQNQTCTVTLKTKELWDYILDGLSIAQIYTDNFVSINWLEFVSKDDPKLPKIKSEEFHHGGWGSDFGDLIFFNIDNKFILTKDSIFTNDIEKVKELIKRHQTEWNKFIEQENMSVNHERYVQWLQQRFPGKIKIRMLE